MDMQTNMQNKYAEYLHPVVNSTEPAVHGQGGLQFLSRTVYKIDRIILQC